MVNNDKFDSVIRRDPVIPFSFVATMANFLLISVLHAIVIYTDILHSCTEGSKWVSQINTRILYTHAVL